MSRRFWRWAAGMVASALLICGGAAFWLLATESGTRWLVARTSPLLPSALQIAEVEGTLINGVHFRSVSWTDETVTVSVDQIHTRFELLPLLRRQVRVNRLDVRNVDVVVHERPPSVGNSAPFSLDLPITLLIETASITNAHVATGAGDLAIEQIWLSGQLSGSALQIDRLDVQSELGDISLSGDTRLTGDYSARTDGSWELRLPNQAPMSGNFRMQGDTSRYDIRHDLTAPYEIMTRGTLAVIEHALVVDLANTWQVISLEAGDARTVDLADGELRIIGSSSEFSFDGSTTVLSGDIPALAITTRGKREAGRIDFESVSIIGELNGYPVNASAALTYANERLQFDNAVVRIGENQVDLDGSYGPRLRLNAALRLSDLTQLGIDAAGALTGEIHFSSDLKTFQASGNVSGERLEWKDYFADKLSAEFDVPTTGRGNAVLQVADARIGNLLLSTGRLSAAGSTQSHTLRAEIVTDQVRGKLELEGRFADETWSGAIETLAVHGEQLGEWALREAADFSLSRSQFNVANACLTTMSNTGVACGMLDYDFSGPLRFDASVNELPLSAFAVNLPEGAKVEGAIEAHASGEFVNQRLTADANLKVHNLNLSAIFEGDEVAAAFDQAFVKASIVDNRLTGELEFRLSNDVDHVRSNIEIADLFDQQSKLSGHGSLELNDLGVFSFFYPDLSNPAGKITGSVEVGGSLGAPEIIGEIGLQNGSFGIRRAGITVTEAELLVRQAKPGYLALQGSARSGEGNLEIQGETTISSNSGVRTELKLNGENFLLVQLPDWQVTASPAIAVVFDDESTRVSGELGIPKASIKIHDVPETAERPSPDVVVHRGDEPIKEKQRALHVDVRTSLGSGVSLSGFGLTTGLEGSVRIAGSSNTPYVSSGRVVLRGGRYQAYGQNLTIESGELLFNGPLSNPALNIRATRTASDKTVAGIHLTGTPTQLKSQVYSEPALSDAEALSYLLTGRPLVNADSEQGDMLNQAAFALGLTSAGGIASRVRNELGFETLGVQGGSDNRRLVAGKRFGNRLLVEYAYGIVDTLGTLLLRYQLSNRLVLESRSGSVRIVDILYSVKKK